MKHKWKFLHICLLLICSLPCFAQYPIPSYRVSVDGRALFEETTAHRGKKDGHVATQCLGVGDGDCLISVYFYSLDHTTVLGPYCMGCNQTLTVPLDEREWGVYVESQIRVVVDVWFTEPTGGETTDASKNPFALFLGDFTLEKSTGDF
jgi:hypothetical protein